MTDPDGNLCAAVRRLGTQAVSMCKFVEDVALMRHVDWKARVILGLLYASVVLGVWEWVVR